MNLVAKLHITGGNIPAFKNSKRAILDRNTGLQRTLTPKKIKERMDVLESGMLSALYSSSQIIADETASECWKRLRTALSGLSDDSLREIPECSFSTQRVEEGHEGVVIEIYEICSP